MKKKVIISLLIFLGAIYFSDAQNTWIQKANFSGGPRTQAVGFSIGSKGYLGIGYNTLVTDPQDFWEYDPITDTWTQLTDFPGSPRNSSFGFGISMKGYIGTGYDSSGAFTKDFWEYDP